MSIPESGRDATDLAAHKPTISEMLQRSVERRGEAPAVAGIVDGQLRWRTWNEVHEDVVRCAVALGELGAGRDVHVAQIATNSYQWIVVDLAIHRLGGVHVPLHAALAPSQCVEQITHSDSRVTVVADGLQSAEALRTALPAGTVASHGELQARAVAGGSATGAAEPRRGDDLATILYTSGTTGEPLGVMLTHGNIATNVVATAEAVGSPVDDTRLCVLPLSHIYARTCDLYSWLYLGSQLVLAESRETILRDCRLASPTVLNAVPYFYRKVMVGLQEKLAETDEAALRGVFGGAVRNLFCGGAGIAPDVETFYRERGLPILSGYGLTEASPVISANSPETYRFGTVGPPLANTEVRLAEDGEILARGPGIFPGYWRNAVATQAALRDGWLYTGDLGGWDEGNLRILGRKKEIIVLNTGKNVAPTAIEQRLSASTLIDQVCVVGDHRNFLTALIVPNLDVLAHTLGKPRPLDDPAVEQLYGDELNRCLADVASYEQIGQFTLLSRAFSAEQGEMTPKMSLRRGRIHENFHREIEQMYAAGRRS